MKKITFFLSFGVICLFLAFVFFPKDLASAKNLCLEIHGKVTANNWSGGTVEVGCGGNTLTAGCTGEIKKITPGPNGDFLLTKCGCSDNDTGKCLSLATDLDIVQDTYKTKSKYVRRIKIVSKPALPANCTSNLDQIPHCGSNGKHIDVYPKITCNVTLTPTPTPTPTVTPTPTITPTPSVCPVPPQVINVKVICENCEESE
jgi:hypothetical protein